MTQQYEIQLPEGLRLMVSITGAPIDFDIVFPDNRRVNFKDAPGQGVSITPMDGLLPKMTDEPKVQGQKPTKKHTISQSSTGPAISYRLYADGPGGPMVPHPAIAAAT
jgi:hypothetical protein